jgi:hypothetical protein
MSTQLPLFRATRPLRFSGATLEPALDAERLTTQYERVFNLMRDGEWRTLAQIRAVTGGSEAAVSARLRDFRKAEHGSHTVERRRVEGGLFEYRVVVSI